MVMTAEDKRAKARARYAKNKKLKKIKQSVSTQKIQKVVRAYLQKNKPKPKSKNVKPPKVYKTEKDRQIATTMKAYHMCCKSANCGKKYKK